MPNGVSRETFQGYSTDSKLDTLFDYIHEIHDTSCKEDSDLKKRVGKLEDRKKFDTGVSGFTGLMGGIVAFIGQAFFRSGG